MLLLQWLLWTIQRIELRLVHETRYHKIGTIERIFGKFNRKYLLEKRRVIHLQCYDQL